jgi:predicted DNA-binding transcriptional regulator AlpA
MKPDGKNGHEGPGAVRLQLLPRLIRLRDAPGYLGMNRNMFNALARPYLTAIPLGKQALAFDRLELDAWVDEYMTRNGRPGLPKGDRLWDAKQHRASRNAPVSGTSTNASADGAFARALEQLSSSKRNAS